MTTENGLIRSTQARRYINRMRRRLDFLAERIAEKATSGIDPAFDVAEAEALAWSIDVCEAEWTALTRMDHYHDRLPLTREERAALKWDGEPAVSR